MKCILCYFSASGITKQVALKMQECLKCDILEIEPINKYTSEDLDWTNSKSRSSVEMSHKSFRPPIKNKLINIDNYDTIILGFPVWWYTAPTIINTFLEENNFLDKDIYVFVTSGSTGVENSINDLRKNYPNLKFRSGKRFTTNLSCDDILSWIDGESEVR